MDENAPLIVATGVLVSTALGATAGASIGVVRSQNPIILSLNMGLNCGVAALAFFGLREYVVSPARRLAAPKAMGSPRTAAVADIRTNRLIDSAIAGGLTGAIMSAGFRGIKTVPRAALTASLVTMGLQSAVNEVRISRLHWLARSTESPSAEELPNASYTSSGGLPAQGLPSKIMMALAAFTPVRKLSDDEYLQVLESRQRDINDRLAAIDGDQQRVLDSTVPHET